MRCVTVQENWVNYSDAVDDRVGNIMLSRMMGADVRLVNEGFGIEFKQSWEQVLEDVRKAGGKPYAIPAGASDHRLGVLGFVGFAEEVRAQECEMGIRFDYIILCSVTGSTQAGMIVGFATDGRTDHVIGIDASAKPDQTRAQITRIAHHTAEFGGAWPVHHLVRCGARHALCVPRIRFTLAGNPPSDPARRTVGRHDHGPSV